MTDISSKHKTTNTRSNLHNSLNKYVYVMYSTCRAVLRAKLDLVTMSSLDFNTCRGMREKVERERERERQWPSTYTPKNIPTRIIRHD